MNGDWFWLSVAWITSVSARIRWFRLLHEQETPGDVSFLRDHGYTASGWVVGDYLRQRSERKLWVEINTNGWIVSWNEDTDEKAKERERERGGEGNLRGNFLPFIRWLKVGIVSRGTWEISFLGMYRDIVSYWKNVYGGGRWGKIFSPSLLCDLFLHAISKLLNREGISKV